MKTIKLSEFYDGLGFLVSIEVPEWVLVAFLAGLQPHDSTVEAVEWARDLVLMARAPEAVDRLDPVYPP